MINVEGDYSEIVEWMDDHPVRGLEYNTHGDIMRVVSECEGEVAQLNYGLFSLMNPSDTHPYDPGECYLCDRNGELGLFTYIHDVNAKVNMNHAEKFRVELAEAPELVRF